jgi:excisionase family DNA binding protein
MDSPPTGAAAGQPSSLPRLLYTPDEAAEITSLSRAWLIAHARKGKIPHRRLGWRTYRFAPEDLEAIKDMAARSVEVPTRRTA